MGLRATSIWNAVIDILGKRRSQRGGRGTSKQYRKLRFECCEDRSMLAVFTVNSILDNGDGANITLREAVALANQSEDAEDIIKFDATIFSNGGTILLTQGELQVNETTRLTIDGRNSIGVPGPARIAR